MLFKSVYGFIDPIPQLAIMCFFIFFTPRCENECYFCYGPIVPEINYSSSTVGPYLIVDLLQCLSQELKKVSHHAEKGETQYHKAETHVSPR